MQGAPTAPTRVPPEEEACRFLHDEDVVPYGFYPRRNTPTQRPQLEPVKQNTYVGDGGIKP